MYPTFKCIMLKNLHPFRKYFLYATVFLNRLMPAPCRCYSKDLRFSPITTRTTEPTRLIGQATQLPYHPM